MAELSSALEARLTGLIQDTVVIDMAWATNPALPAPIVSGKPLLDRTIASGISAACITVADYHQNFRQALEELNRIYLLESSNPDAILLVDRIEDIERAQREKRLGLVVHFQTATPLEDDWPNTLPVLHRLGLRMMQLTYNEANRLGSGCGENHDHGLTAYGAQVVGAMNSLGIIVDLSHVGPTTAMDAIRRSREPVIFSHSNAAALVAHPRNLSDETIRALRDNGGVIGVTAFGPFCSSGSGTAASLSDYLDHVEHMLQVAGPDHVGIGTDIGENAKVLPIPAPYEVQYGDGLDRRAEPRQQTTEVVGFERLDLIANVVKGLAERGHDDGLIRKILGENFLRVAQAVWG